MLRIALRAGERMIINGALIQATGRSEFCIENQATILRAREVMKPEEATSPARQLYFHTMMAYVDEAHRRDHEDRLVEALRLVRRRSDDAETLDALSRYAAAAAGGDHYRALQVCRDLIDFEGRSELAA